MLDGLKATVDAGKETVEIQESVPHRHNAGQKGGALFRITRHVSYSMSTFLLSLYRSLGKKIILVNNSFCILLRIEISYM